MKWITKIVEIHSYRITCQWNDGVSRSIDLENFLRDKGKNPKNSYNQLLNKKRFSEVKCDGSTLYWENGITMKDVDGTIKLAPLDIDPEVLYEMAVQPRPG